MSMSAAVSPELASAFSAANVAMSATDSDVGDAPLGDADPVADPGVVGVDHRGQFVVGDARGWAGSGRATTMREPAAGAGNARSCGASDAGQRLAGGHRVVVVRQPLDERARAVRGHVDRALPGVDRADHLAVADLVALGEAGGRRERAAGAGDHDPELGVRLVGRVRAVPGDRVAGLAQVVGGVDGDDLDALDGALDQPGQGAGRGPVR